MEYQVGDAVRIIDDPSKAEEAWDHGMFQYKSCEATIIRAETDGRRQWYELDIDQGGTVWLASDFVRDKTPEVDMALFEEVVIGGI